MRVVVEAGISVQGYFRGFEEGRTGMEVWPMRTQNNCRGLDYGYDLIDCVAGVLLVVEAVLLSLVLFLTVSGQTSSYDLQNRHNQPDPTRTYATPKEPFC